MRSKYVLRHLTTSNEKLFIFFNNIVIKIFIAKKVAIPTTMKNIFF